MDEQRINDELLDDILLSLATMDEALQPSPQFHSNLMQRLRAESAVVADMPETDTSGKEVGTMMVQRSLWQKFKEGLKERQLRAWAPVALGACAMVLVVLIGWNDLINFGSEASMSADNVAQAPKAMDIGEAAFNDAKLKANVESGTAGQVSSKETRYGMMAEDNETMPVIPPEDSGAVPPMEQEQKIIYNGNIGLEVDRYEQTVQTIKQAVQAAGGYIVNEQRYNLDDKGRLAGDLSLRIPYQQFSELLNQAGALGKVTYQNTSARDVTTEFVDVEARLKVMEAKENRLLELLGKTGSLTDVLAVEQELANTRAELESLKGQLRYLTNQTDYSTLNVSIQEKPLAASGIQISGFTGLWLRIKEAFMLGINSILTNTGNLIVWVVQALPILLIGGLALWCIWIKLIKKWWQRRHDQQ